MKFRSMHRCRNSSSMMLSGEPKNTQFMVRYIFSTRPTSHHWLVAESIFTKLIPLKTVLIFFQNLGFRSFLKFCGAMIIGKRLFRCNRSLYIFIQVRSAMEKTRDDNCP